MMAVIMETRAEVIADSIDDKGNRLTTMEVTFHRFVLAEFNTHRVFSRNSASSRAIPVEKQIKMLFDSPAFPVSWASEQPGMQGGTDLTGEALEDAQELFQRVYEHNLYEVLAYLKRHPNKSERLHKSLINRLLEPFMWHTVIVTSTEWDNFFQQRCSPLAQPEIRVAAEMMESALRSSEPDLKRQGQWHLPYIQEDEQDLPLELKIKLSAARCARVSYLTHDGVRDINKDIELYEKLVTADPPHWSPLEHVARPIDRSLNSIERSVLELPGNFSGWVQLRHIVDPSISWLK